MAKMDLTSVSALLKDLYVQPGDRLKQWVVDSRRESEWESRTCPLVAVEVHDDNTGSQCRNTYATAMQWRRLTHDCCHTCNKLQDANEQRPDIAEWLIEKSKRPPIEKDHSKYSDEVQADYPLLHRLWSDR